MRSSNFLVWGGRWEPSTLGKKIENSSFSTKKKRISTFPPPQTITLHEDSQKPSIETHQKGKRDCFVWLSPKTSRATLVTASLRSGELENENGQTSVSWIFFENVKLFFFNPKCWQRVDGSHRPPNLKFLSKFLAWVQLKICRTPTSLTKITCNFSWKKLWFIAKQ